MTATSLERPARTTFLPFARPDIGPAELDHVREALENGWMTTGPKAQQFEKEFAARVGASYAIAVNSCTAALHLALEATGLKAGDEVITTPYTFAASAEVIRYFGARPVFVDVDARTFNIQPELIEPAITPRTKAILPVHIAGLAAELDPINEIAARHGLAVIEDAAHSFPATYRGRTIGSISDVTCFSFYATKTITTGEGGMICTESEAIADRCRLMSLHGISRDAWKRYTAEGSWFYEVLAAGFKYNLTDVAAGIGLGQLTKADAMLRRRREIAGMYDDAFSEEEALQTPARLDDREHAWHLYMLRLNLDRLTIDRGAFIERLKERQIGTSVHFIPLHTQPYYRDTYGLTPDACPVAYAEYLREISLPIYSKMSDDDVRDVIDAVLGVVRAHRG